MGTPVHYTTPETGLIDSEVLSQAMVREIEFAQLFKEDVHKLTEALGISRKIPVTAGTALKIITATGTLDQTVVYEGQLIPLSNYSVTATTVGEAMLDKWRKATSAEAIVQYGYEQAVVRTTDSMRRDVQKRVRKNFYLALDEYSTSTDLVTENFNIQSALASLWGGLQKVYEDTAIEAVYFANPMDVASYLATAQITTQTAFGMSYVEDFMGIGTLILSTDIEAGTVYATAKDNIVLYYIPVNGADLGNAFNFTSDETGLIGIHEEADYKTMTAEDVVISGVNLFVEVAKGVLKVSAEEEETENT